MKVIGESILSYLRSVQHVHALKMRVKDPLRLIDKILRKKKKEPGINITPENYFQHVKDLVGVRALHLFKHHWVPILDAIVLQWPPADQPEVFYREGDAKEILEAYNNMPGLKVKFKLSVH